MMIKASASFSEEKEAKRLLLLSPRRCDIPAQRDQKFFAPPAGRVALFFKKAAIFLDHN
jgi:hypothetical protein